MNGSQKDGFLSVGAQMGAIKLAMAGRIGGANFWITDSIAIVRTS